MINNLFEGIFTPKICYNAYNLAVTYFFTVCIRLEQFYRGELLIFWDIFGQWDWAKESESTFFYLLRLALGWLLATLVQKKIFLKDRKKQKDKQKEEEG